jgi:alpha-L-rhamnosidase
VSSPELSAVPPTDPALRVTLTVRRSPDGLAGRAPLRLDWRVTQSAGGHATSRTQQAYQLQAAADPSFTTPLAESGAESDQQLDVVAPGDPLHSRETRHLRVRVATEAGWSPWSAPATVEAGLLAPSDWSAVAITLADDEGTTRQAPSPLLRTEFTLASAPVRARLHVTSHGLNEVRLNGTVVGDELLAPGWTAYQQRLLVSTHDVTDLLAEGRNAIGALLGDGWYRGRLGWDPVDDRGRYGTTLALLAQLEVDLADGSRVVVGTGPDWVAATGETRSADLYDGCAIDLREHRAGWDRPGFDQSGWAAAQVVPLDLRLLAPRVAPPVRVVAELAPTRSTDPDGAVRLDAGQNVAGFVRLTVRGSVGQAVVVRHAEVLEADGALHTLSLRSAKATDTYVLADDQPVMLQPRFTFHGFRYAEVVTEAEVLDAQVVAISSDTPRRGRFTSSHATLNRFHENVVWSQRDNFVSVPTDCPQRDERLGWTGDAQAFVPTAGTLFDSREFWSSWLVDLAIDQARDGAVGSVVPNVLGTGELALGRTGWADAGTIVPWAVHEAYADTELLARQLTSMVDVVTYLLPRRDADGYLGGEFQFGDWLDPDAPGDQPQKAKCDCDYLANAFLSHSARLVAKAAAVLGRDDLVATYTGTADETAARTWARWADHAQTTQTGCAVALQLAIAPQPDHAAVGRALATLVREANGRIATGFLGTPLVLPALTATGHLAEAYLMLLRREMPSWLYQVDQGATTVWERWDAIRPDGTIHDGIMHMPDGDGHMLSFNHYAYGAVIDWVYRTLAGLAPDADRPGYRHVVLAPQPVRGIDQVSASVESALGPVSVSWSCSPEDTFIASYVVPFGATATFTPPATADSVVTVDGAVAASTSVTFGPGEHSVEVTRAWLADPSTPSTR